MATGTIIKIDPNSGYGQIRPDSRDEHVVFVAEADVRPWWPGDRVTYTATIPELGVFTRNLDRLGKGL